MPYIKNVPHEAIFSLADQVQVQPGQVVSKTLAQNDAVSVTLFAFAAGEEIGTHDSTGDAMVTVLEGVGQFTIDGVPYLVKPGEALVMPAKKPHSVYALENFKWMLTVIFLTTTKQRKERMVHSHPFFFIYKKSPQGCNLGVFSILISSEGRCSRSFPGKQRSCRSRQGSHQSRHLRSPSQTAPAYPARCGNNR